MDCGTYSNDFVVTLEGKIYILVNIEPPIGSGEKEPRPVFMRFHGKLSEAQNLQYINELMYIRELVQEAKLVNEKRAEDAKAAQPKKPSASKKVITAVIFILLAFFMVFEGLSTRDSGRVVLVMMMWFAYKFVCIDDLTTNKNAKIAFLVQTCGLIVVYLLACVIFNFYGLSTLMGTTVSMA